MISTENTVISSRVRLARNIEGYPFPSRFKDEKQAKEVIRLAASGLNRLEEFTFYYMDKISDELALSLKENHLISPYLIENRRNSAVLINGDRTVSVMINEEDHLREQCFKSGFDIRGAYETMTELDSKISASMKFAYDEQFGFLTACPTNLGTGLRASVMMFLPAITLNGIMPRAVRSVKRQGMTVRGAYGEGTEAEGFIYQISNEVTLGYTEEEILKLVGDTVFLLCELEDNERKRLIKGNGALDVKDNCMRSLGMLLYCEKLSAAELSKLAAAVKLGICLKYIDFPNMSSIDDHIVKMRPSNITAAAGRQLTAEERDIYRAERTRRFFKKYLMQ